MAINQEIISTSWEGQQKSYIEAGLKTLLQRMLEVLESPLAANSVGSNQLTQELRDVINSIGSKVPNTRTVNSKELSSNITIGPDDIMVGNQTLADKLDDMDDAIGQGGDTSGLETRIATLEKALDDLTGTEDTTQIIDTFNEVIDFLANVNNNETLLGKLQQLQTQINSKANDNAVVKSISVNGGTPQTPQNGNVNIQVQAGSTISPATAAPSMDGTANVGSSDKYAREDHVHPHDTTKLSKSDVSVETQGDGTVDINVGSGANKDTYTINLNHTHENMAKLVVDTAANLPDASEMESDTIYGELDDGEIATIYLGGYPFYGGGGGASSGPVLRKPADGATINMGQTTSGTVNQTITVKGKSLTQALTIELDGTGYTFGTTQPSGVTRDSATQLTVTAAAANALNGVDIVVVYTGNDTDEDASGTLGITSNDNISAEATLVANKVTYEDLAGVKLTGTQWLQTDYYPNPNTEFRLECKFTANARTTNPSTGNVGSFLRCDFDSNTSEQRFSLHTASAVSNNSTGAYHLFYWNNSGTDGQASIDMEACASQMVADHAVISYAKGSSAGTLTFNGGTPRSVSTTLQTETLTSPMCIGYRPKEQTIFNVFDLTIYEFTITEGGNVVRHWVPKLRRGTTPGLYDTITGSFISSETNDELVAIPLT